MSRLSETEAISELSSPDRLPDTDLAERVIRGLHAAVAQYVAAHPGHLSRFASRAVVDMYRALSKHNLAELSTRLDIAIAEVEQCEIVAINHAVHQALGEAQRFLRYGATMTGMEGHSDDSQ